MKRQENNITIMAKEIAALRYDSIGDLLFLVSANMGGPRVPRHIKAMSKLLLRACSEAYDAYEESTKKSAEDMERL